MTPEPSTSNKICFVIAPIGEPGGEIRKRADLVFKHIIKRASKEAGFEPLRADQIAAPGSIPHQVVNHLIDDAIVIADLSGHNPNVFYELGIRHTLRKPVIQLIEKDEPIPFDLVTLRTVIVDHQDLDSAEEAREQLIKYMTSIRENPGVVDSPVSIAVELSDLRAGTSRDERIATLLASLQTQHEMLRDLNGKVQMLASTSKGTLGKSKSLAVLKRERALKTLLNATGWTAVEVGIGLHPGDEVPWAIFCIGPNQYEKVAAPNAESDEEVVEDMRRHLRRVVKSKKSEAARKYRR